MAETSLEAQVRSLFAPDERGIFTCAAGYSNAMYDQYTELSRHLHGQMLRILEAFDIEYFLFAGSMVGYVRNGEMPFWMDDLDIIIFEDAVPRFEEVALPALREVGYNCFAQERNIGGGFHLLAMQQGNSRALSIALSRDRTVSVPWAQIDAFYTTVDEGGFLRNPKGWGLYHSKNVPLDWVRPGRMVQIGDMKVRAFSELEKDIALEYGDVHNNIVIHNHSTTYLKALDTPWARFEELFLKVLSETTTDLPETVTRAEIDAYQPEAGKIHFVFPDEDFSTICAGIVKARADTVRLTNGDQTFWAMDFKRLFPGITVHAAAADVLQAQRAAQLHAFVDRVDCTTDAAAAEYRTCLAGLQRILGTETPG